MGYRYTKFGIRLRKFYRVFFPVPKSPYTLGEVKDICSVNLVPPEKLIGFFTKCVKILRDLKGDDIGDYLEFGVFNGASLSSMHKVAKAEKVDEMKMFGFDAFQGLPQDAENEDFGVWKQGFYTCSFEQMCACLARKDIDPGTITWIIGRYNKTLTQETAKKNNIDNIGIVVIDCDTYSSSKSVLDFLAPLLKQPAILCFDDWKLFDLDVKGGGEYRSFNEFLEANSNFKATEIKSYNRKSRSFLITFK